MKLEAKVQNNTIDPKYSPVTGNSHIILILGSSRIADLHTLVSDTSEILDTKKSKAESMGENA